METRGKSSFLTISSNGPGERLRQRRNIWNGRQATRERVTVEDRSNDALPGEGIDRSSGATATTKNTQEVDSFANKMTFASLGVLTASSEESEDREQQSNVSKQSPIGRQEATRHHLDGLADEFDMDMVPQKKRMHFVTIPTISSETSSTISSEQESESCTGAQPVEVKSGDKGAQSADRRELTQSETMTPSLNRFSPELNKELADISETNPDAWHSMKAEKEKMSASDKEGTKSVWQGSEAEMESQNKRIPDKEKAAIAGSTSARKSPLPSNQSKGPTPMPSIVIKRRLDDLTTMLKEFSAYERSAQAQSEEAWFMVKNQLLVINRLFDRLSELSNTKEMNQDQQQLVEKTTNILQTVTNVSHHLKRLSKEREQSYFCQNHNQQLLNFRLNDLKEAITRFLHSGQTGTTEHAEFVNFSPLTKGMEQVSPDNRNGMEKAREIESVNDFSTEPLDQLRAKQVSIQMECEETRAKLEVLKEALKAEEIKHKLYSMQNAKMLYSQNSCTEDLQNLLEEGNKLCQKIKKVKSVAKMQIDESLTRFQQDKKQIICDIKTELELVKAVSVEAVNKLSRAKEAYISEKDQALSEIYGERAQMELEMKQKEELFVKHYQAKEESLVQEVAFVREEIVIWGEFKQKICEEHHHLKSIHAEILEQRSQQDKDKTWIAQKQEELKNSMEQHQQMVEKLRKETEKHKRMLEACNVLKKQIELSILFHKDQGMVQQIVYWDSTQVRAYIEPSAVSLPSIQGITAAAVPQKFSTPMH